MVRRSPRLNKRLYETTNILLSLSNQNEEDSVSMTIIEKKTARKNNVKFIENMNEDDDPSSDYSPEDEASDHEASDNEGGEGSDNEEDDDPSSDYEGEEEASDNEEETNDNEEDDDPSSDYEGEEEEEEEDEPKILERMSKNPEDYEEDEIIEALKTNAEQEIRLCNYAAARGIYGDKAIYNEMQTLSKRALDIILKIKQQQQQEQEQNKKQARAKTSGNCNHILPLVLAATITGAIAVSVPFY